MNSNNLRYQTFKGAIWASIERFSGQGIQFLVMIVMARILDPSDYGLVGMVAVFTAIFQTLIDGGFSQALIRKQDRTDIDNSTAFYFNIVVGLVLYLLMFFMAPLAADFYKEPRLVGIMRVISITVIFNSLAIVQIALYTSRVDFKTQSKATVTAAVISGIIGITTAYSGVGTWALVYQQLSNSIVYCILLWIFSNWRPLWAFSIESFKELFGFGSKILFGSIINTVYNNLYQLLIGKFFAANVLGLYSRASHFADFPSANVSGIIQRVTYPILCQVQDDKTQLLQIYRKFIKISCFIIFPLMTILAGVSKPFVILVLGEKWAYCSLLLLILCFSRMWYPIHHLNVNILQAIGRSDLTLRLEYFKKAFGLLTISVSLPLGIEAMCYAAIVSCIFALYVNTYYVGRLLNVGFFIQMKDVMPTLIISLIAFGISFTIQFIVESLYIQLIGGCCLGFFFYIASAHLFRFTEFKDIKNLIRK